MSDAPSLRETLESAINAEAEAPAEPQLEAPAVEAQAELPLEAAPDAPQKPRDEAGKFAKEGAQAPKKATPDPKATPPQAKQVPAAQGKPAGAEPSPSTPAGEPAPVLKAPQSWKPAVRELASKLPAEFKPILEEANRLDREVRTVMQESAQARQLATQVQQTLAPFESLARSNGMDPVKYAGTVMQTAAALQMGTPAQKAQVVAQLLQTYAVDPDLVNAQLQGQGPPQAAQRAPQQDVSHLVEQAIQQRVAQAQQARVQKEAEEFVQSAPEFLQDVWQQMGMLKDAAAAQGRNMSWQQAYDAACRLDEGISETLAQRKAADATRAQAPTVRAAKVAGSSIKAIPAGAAPRSSGPRTLREDLEEAIAAQR